MTGGLAWVAAIAVLAGCGATRSPQAPTPPPSTPRAGAGIPARLLREARAIGRGPRFQPPARGPVPSPCRPALGPRRGVHVELFAADQVVVIAPGIGVRGPVRRDAGRIVSARCFARFVTLEPTGVVLLAPGARPTLGDLFQAWGQPLSQHRAGPFTGAGRVRTYVAGRRVGTDARALVLTPHAEVVVEVGPYVPPHTSYTFPPGR